MDDDALLEPLVTENKFYRNPALLITWEDLFKECKLGAAPRAPSTLSSAAEPAPTDTEGEVHGSFSDSGSGEDEMMACLKEVVNAFLDVAYNTKGDEDCLKKYPSLADSNIKPNAIADAVEKADAIHSLRCALACLDAQPLWDAVHANCKYAGPKVAVTRRDLTLPVWWNPDCDIILMRLVVVRATASGRRFAQRRPWQIFPWTLICLPDSLDLSG